MSGNYVTTCSLTETDLDLFHKKLNNKIDELQKIGLDLEVNCNSVMVGSNLTYTAFILGKTK